MKPGIFAATDDESPPAARNADHHWMIAATLFTNARAQNAVAPMHKTRRTFALKHGVFSVAINLVPFLAVRRILYHNDASAGLLLEFHKKPLDLGR